MSAPHCCQAKQKKTFRAGPRSVHGSSSEKKRTGVVDSPGTIPSNRPNLFSESSPFRSRCHRAAFGLTVAFIRLHSHGLSRLSGSPASLDSGIPEIDVDQRLHNQSIVAQPGPSPPPGAGNTPSWKCRPPSREISTSRSRFSSGGGWICSVFAVCLSRHPRTREHARCRVGYRIQRWMVRCRGALPVGCGCLLSPLPPCA